MIDGASDPGNFDDIHEVRESRREDLFTPRPLIRAVVGKPKIGTISGEASTMNDYFSIIFNLAEYEIWCNLRAISRN